MIPPSALEGLSDLPVSRQLRDAAADLGFRLAHGEYEDLDEMQRMDLQSLAQMMEYWADRVAELESAGVPPASLDRRPRAKP